MTQRKKPTNPPQLARRRTNSNGACKWEGLVRKHPVSNSEKLVVEYNKCSVKLGNGAEYVYTPDMYVQGYPTDEKTTTRLWQIESMVHDIVSKETLFRARLVVQVRDCANWMGMRIPDNAIAVTNVATLLDSRAVREIRPVDSPPPANAQRIFAGAFYSVSGRPIDPDTFAVNTANLQMVSFKIVHVTANPTLGNEDYVKLMQRMRFTVPPLSCLYRFERSEQERAMKLVKYDKEAVVSAIAGFETGVVPIVLQTAYNIIRSLDDSVDPDVVIIGLNLVAAGLSVSSSTSTFSPSSPLSLASIFTNNNTTSGQSI